MAENWSLYHPELPEPLRRLADTPPMRRLRQVGMNCGCEYTAFPRFAGWAPYSRFDHSVGMGLIVWHFTGDLRQSAAGLLHDVATPVFAHTVDFLNGDHLRQESTEARTAEVIAASPELRALLAEYGLAPEDVSDCHRFPIADNDAPRLCADRLEYTLGNLRSYGFADGDALRAFYADLTAANNEGGVPELAFRTPETACAFTEAALSTGRIYVADEDRFAMQALADLLRAALDRGVLTEADLHTTEPLVIRKLEADPETAAMWCRFRAYRRLDRTPRQPAGTGWIQVPAKLRYIDPLIAGVGRVSRCSPRIAGLLAEFRRTDLACWLRGE